MMMMTRSALTTVILAGLSAVACYARPTMTALKPAPGLVSNFSVGAIRVAAPGQVMIERTEGSDVLPGFVLEKPIRIHGLSRQPPEATGAWKTRFEYEGSCPTGRFVLTNPYFYRERLGIIVTDNGTIDCPHPVIQLGGAKKGRAWDLVEPLPLQPFRPTTVVAKLRPEIVRWELVFVGHANDRLTVSTREYFGETLVRKTRAGTTRQEFALALKPTREKTLVFDLAKDKTVSYRGVKLEIQSTANDQLVYRVVGDAGDTPAATAATTAPAAAAAKP